MTLPMPSGVLHLKSASMALKSATFHFVHCKSDSPTAPEVRFNYAFFVMSFSNKAVAVFAEHCGYFVLPIAELEIAVEEFGRGELM